MKNFGKGIVVLGMLAVTGAASMSWEHRFSGELREAGLLKRPLALGTREKLGQTSSAVALGGLRTLVATFLNLRAFDYFETRNWHDLEKTYDVIVELAPNTRYYWENGSWHLAYNAAGDYQQDPRLPALRRREAWKEAIARGREFLEAGIRNNPDDWHLRADLGRLLEDPHKIQDHAAGAEAFRTAWETGKAPMFIRRSYFYSLARVPGRQSDALALGRGMFRDPRNRLPTLLAVLFVLETRAGTTERPLELADRLFDSETAAYQVMSLYWHRSAEQLPMDGVADLLRQLEARLGIPAARSVFSSPGPTFMAAPSQPR
jgi:hypothetical protein